MRYLTTIALVVFFWADASAQAPILTTDQKAMVQLNNEVERLNAALNTALAQIHDILLDNHNLTIVYNALRASVMRERSTPEMDGYQFDWTFDPKTGQRRGLIADDHDHEDR